jgi:hypothetical protein
MKLLNIITARTVWLFDALELNPYGRKYEPNIFNWAQSKYKFEKVPESILDTDESKALVFSRGNFKVNDELSISIDMKVFNDGIIADSRSSTRHTDAFIDQVLRSLASDYKLNYYPEIIRHKIHLSEVNIWSEKRLDGIHKNLRGFADKISSLISGSPKAPIEIAAVIFSPLPTIQNVQLSPFTFERKSGTLPEENKYYSRAPLHTDDHINLLNEFEATFMS